MRCVRVRLRAGTADRVRGAVAGWSLRRDEALESLRDEGLVRESVFLEHTGEGDYLLLVQTGRDLNLAAERFATSALPLAAEKRRLLTEVTEHAIAIELLAHHDLAED
ncbi:DUF6176 family protein [Streptoalloteichus tenebrarius]|uniref:DUF6176 family protein n=1 Tax=Streptoalloteichus tenebrarius (strain ATCC 17920 / DSM 40477 / JCM 4838 / CBS 697.72 / NBRC 16177 / NCIMB 11028 / NRRL B-12390 / A12253. 1 / ISP 5477) TaxID=1933 RepID=UPI0020A5E4D1|nr:DUF6176 family protein [Streptoalloteichus tenebrarius]